MHICPLPSRPDVMLLCDNRGIAIAMSHGICQHEGVNGEGKQECGGGTSRRVGSR
jgi:hypothetical protein